MILDYFFTDGKTQACSAAGSFGGKERIGQVIEILRPYPLTLVPYLQQYGSGYFIHAGTDSQGLAFFSQCLARVLNKVDDHLFDLLKIAFDPGFFA